MYKYAEMSNNCIIHTNNMYKLDLIEGEQYNLTTEHDDMKYYIYMACNASKLCDESLYNYNDILYIKALTFNTDILSILFNYKQKPIILKKLYEYIITNSNPRYHKYIFNCFKNTEKQYYTPLTDFYITNNKLLGLIIDMLRNIINHPKAYEYYNPRPDYIYKITNDYIYANCINNDKQVINSTLSNIYSTLENIDDILKNDTNYKYKIESELFQNYTLGYHILYISILEFNKFYLEPMIISNITNNITIYKIHYNNKSVADKFDKLLHTEKNNIGWHGSNISNWYNILYNGLVAGSKKNNTIKNGSAYGEGIYISDTLGYSITYSKTITNKDKNSQVMVGVFQIENGITKYKKANQIYVIPDSNLVCMRYLIVGSPSVISKNITSLDNYFIKSHTVNTLEDTQTIQRKGNGRIMKEIKLMTQYNTGEVDNNGLDMRFNLLNDQINIWRCQILKDNFKDYNALYQDFINYTINAIEFEILLPEKYPFEPPFIRIVKPRFEFLSGHITRGGSICMELLTKQGWTSSISIDKVLLMIKQNIMDGKARIDSNYISHEYSYREAVEAYDRMLKNHPEWTKF